MRWVTGLLAMFLVARAGALPTENYGFSVLPATVAVDGEAGEWDLGQTLFVCGDVNRYAETYALRFGAKYDEKYLYVLAYWFDKTPWGSTQLRLWTGVQHDRHDEEPSSGLVTRSLLTVAPEAEADAAPASDDAEDAEAAAVEAADQLVILIFLVSAHFGLHIPLQIPALLDQTLCCDFPG